MGSVRRVGLGRRETVTLMGIPGAYTAGTATRVDDLCPLCYLPALWAIPVYRLHTDADGNPSIIHAGTVRVCADCKYRHTMKGPL